MIFGIRGNIYKNELASIVQRLVKSLDKEGVEYICETELAQLVKRKSGHSIKKKSITSEKELVKVCDFMVSIGGDGTFLATAKLVGSKNLPIIGVNVGKLGFLAETATKDSFNFIKKIIQGKYIIDERTVLEAASINGNSASRSLFGVNEIVIHQNDLVKTIEISVFFNNQLVNSYHADGMIISTPTGSTGYSLSAGGPIVFPKTEVFILSPISPHTLTARPVILPDNGIFKVKINSRVPVNMVADGNDILKLKAPALIEIRKAPYKIKIAKSLESNYFNVLTSKLLWGEDKRKKDRL